MSKGWSVGKIALVGVLLMMLLSWVEDNKGTAAALAGAHGAGSALGAAGGAAGGGALGGRSSRGAHAKRDRVPATTTTTEAEDEDDEGDAEEFSPVVPSSIPLLPPVLPQPMPLPIPAG